MPHNKIILTEDGSHTIKSAQFGVDYHSIHGAVQESKHIFIEAGLKHLLGVGGNKDISILEMGLGTGLNAFLTLLEAEKMQTPISYTAIEKYPLEEAVALQLNYAEKLDALDNQADFLKIHACPFDKEVTITGNFHFTKHQADLLSFEPDQKFNLIYFDAFAPEDQPELWSEAVFTKLYQFAEDNCILTTYCVKGDVKRALRASGWTVKKIPGPPGKREMLRAIKQP